MIRHYAAHALICAVQCIIADDWYLSEWMSEFDEAKKNCNFPQNSMLHVT